MNAKIEETLKTASDLLVLPGTDLMAKGKKKQGAVHMGLGLLGTAVLGWPAMLLVGGNSYLKLKKAKQEKEAAPDSEVPVGTAAMPRPEGLEQQIREGLNAGLSLDEIKAALEEDVEDMFFEVQSRTKLHETSPEAHPERPMLLLEEPSTPQADHVARQDPSVD